MNIVSKTENTFILKSGKKYLIETTDNEKINLYFENAKRKGYKNLKIVTKKRKVIYSYKLKNSNDLFDKNLIGCSVVPFNKVIKKNYKETEV